MRRKILLAACSAALLITSEASPRISLIYAKAWASSSVNVLANQSSTLLTAGDRQYAAFYAADSHLMLACRRIGQDVWEVKQTAYTGNVADAHNTVAIAVDGAGYLHVAWDHHANTLNYARSVAPGSLELGPRQSMTGLHEGSVTYPMFFRQPDGGLLFLYRDGRSGRGNVVLNRYDPSVGRWQQVHDNVIDGEGARSAYLAAIVDPRGTLHLAWNWRDSGDVATNHDLCYAKSADSGITWTTSKNAPLELPITAANAEYALRIPQNSTLMNPPSLTVNAEGYPFLVSYWAPAGAAVPQFQLVRYDGTAWSVLQVTRRTQAFELRGTATKRPPISRAAILTRRLPSGTDSFHLIYRDDERGGRVMAVSCANLNAPVWHETGLTVTTVGAWEPSIDASAWAQFDEAHLLLETVQQQDGSDTQPIDTQPSPISLLVWRPD